MHKLFKSEEKVAPDMKKTIKSCPRDAKPYIFRSAAHTKTLSFFDKVFTIRVAMGDVNLKNVPEASIFRGDTDFEGPGAQTYHF